jgi:hypothetical protein
MRQRDRDWNLEPAKRQRQRLLRETRHNVSLKLKRMLLEQELMCLSPEREKEEEQNEPDPPRQIIGRKAKSGKRKK